MVRETRHLWVGNLPDNIREDRIREHFKRYGRVQNVKLLGRAESAAASASAVTSAGATAVSGICATVAFMDIKSASKAHNAEHVLDERTLTTEYYEPAAIPSAAAGAPSAGSSPAGSGYSGSSSSVNSAPGPTSSARYHLSGGEESNGTSNMAAAAAAAAAAVVATAAAPANWRGTNDSATDFCRRGNTPAGYGRYQRNNSAPYSTPPSNVDRTPLSRWYASGERGGGESTPSTPGAPEASVRSARRRRSGSGGSSRSRSDTSSPDPSDESRASTPANSAPSLTATSTPHHQHNHRNSHSHQWSSSTASGRPLAICVRNLPTRSTDSSLKDGLYHEYKKHGKVVWVKVVGQNADRYAIVRFKKPSDVEKALEVSQDKLFFGCKISVAPHQSCDEDAESVKPYETDIDEYHPKATRTLFIGNLEKDVTQQQLRDKFKHFGRIIEIDIKKGSGGGAGYAFCQYASISSVVEAIRAMDGEYVGSSRVKLGFGKPVATTCVWVDGLTEHTEKQVLGAVSRCGAATSVCVDRAAGAALVHFEQAAAASAAVRELRRVAAHASAADPDHPRLCVDYASRECQEAFYEQLEKHGGSAALAGTERLVGDLASRYVPPTRHDSLRYESTGSRSRASSYGRSASRTPRYPAPAAAPAPALEPYDTADYDRRYRVFDEVGASPPPEEALYEDRLQSVVASPTPRRRHRRDSSPDDHKHSSKEWHRSVVGTSAGVVCTVSGRHRSRSGSRRRHRRRRDDSASRGATPLRDEPPDAAPQEPRRPTAPRDRSVPMMLPLPKFALELRAAPPPPPPPAAPPAPASPARPPERPPSASSSSASSAPHSPAAELEERIRSLDEKYERWSRLDPPAPPVASAAAAAAVAAVRSRHRLLELDINEVKPSDVVRSLLAKRSVFDEDSERLQRPPSPDHPRPRALQYPFPTHDAAPATPSTPVTPATPATPATDDDRSSSTTRSDLSERSSDPRCNRIDFKSTLSEKLVKIESDHRTETRFRLRTPSTEKRPQREQPERSSACGKEREMDADKQVAESSENLTEGNGDAITDIIKIEPARDETDNETIPSETRNEETPNPKPVEVPEIKKEVNRPATPKQEPEEISTRPAEKSLLQANLFSPKSKRDSEESSTRSAEKSSLLNFFPFKSQKEPEELPSRPLEKSTLFNLFQPKTQRQNEDGTPRPPENLLNFATKSKNGESSDKEKVISKTTNPPLVKTEPLSKSKKSRPPSPKEEVSQKQTSTKSEELSKLELEINDEINKMSQLEPMSTETFLANIPIPDEPRPRSDKVKEPIKEPTVNHFKEYLERKLQTPIIKDTPKKETAPQNVDVTKSSSNNEKSKDKNNQQKAPIEGRHSGKETKPENSEKPNQAPVANHVADKPVQNKSQDDAKPERERSRSTKDRGDREKYDSDKQKTNRHDKDRHSEKIGKEKRNSVDESAKKSLFEKIDKVRTDKEKSEKEVCNKDRDAERSHKDRERDADKAKYHDEKSSRHDHYRKEKRKENEDKLEKAKKDEKHKHDRHRKEHSEPKKDQKKESDSKSRKSSRDESSRDFSRKDSTDSSTSRASFDSTNRAKETDNQDLKDDLKLKNKTAADYVSRIKKEKESPPKTILPEDNNIKIKTEIKEEKVEHKNRHDYPSESHSKTKLESLDKHRHYSLDSPSVDNKRKERLNSCSSLPSHIGHKRRMSSQDSIDLFTDDTKKIKTEPKAPERRDSKDSRSTDRHKTTKFSKGHFAKIIESKTKEDKKNHVKPPDDPADVKVEPKEHKYEKFKAIQKSPKLESEEKPNCNSEVKSEGLQNDLDFLATLQLRSSEEDEKQRALRKEMKEKKRIQQLQQIQELQMQQDALAQAELGKGPPAPATAATASAAASAAAAAAAAVAARDRRKDAAREKRMSTDRKSRDEKIEKRKSTTKKVHSSDTSDSDEPKKHSIFDIVDDGPTYISMYDKVKARSCKNMQKQEEEKRQEKIKAKFSQLKQSRAKREEKKRSSWDEDSDSDADRKHAKTSASSSEDDQNASHNRKRDKYPGLSFDSDRSLTNDFFAARNDNPDESRKPLPARKNSRSRIMSDTSDEEALKRSVNKICQRHSDSESLPTESDFFNKVSRELEMPSKEAGADRIKKNSLLNLFGKSDSDESKLKSNSGENDIDYKSRFFKNITDFSSENESISSHLYSGENRKKHKKKQKRSKIGQSDEDVKLSVMESLESGADSKHRHSDKSRRHSNKKEKRRDKVRESFDTDEPREDKTKPRKNKVQNAETNIDTITNSVKKDGKMEDIFGPLSDDSDNASKNNCDEKQTTNEFEPSFGTSFDFMSKNTDEMKKDKEDIKRKKDKKRKEKERRHHIKDDENSLDVDAVGKAIEARLCADTDDDSRPKTEPLSECLPKQDQSLFKFTDENAHFGRSNSENQNNEKIKRDGKEKKKKKKRSKEDRQNRKEHHINRLDLHQKHEIPIIDITQKDITDKENLGLSESKVLNSIDHQDISSAGESPSLPRITDSPPITPRVLDNSDKNNASDMSDRLTIDESMDISGIDNDLEIKDTPQVERIASTGPMQDALKTDQTVDFDRASSDNAVRSISNLNVDKKSSNSVESHVAPKHEEKVEEKPRAVISQEETADAVAALLGESFGGNESFSFDEIDDNSNQDAQNSSMESENIPEEDAEEMRQAVQNLNASEMELKPDTPLSDNDLLLIDTDTEEADEAAPDALEKLPVNIIATNPTLNASAEVASSSKPIEAAVEVASQTAKAKLDKDPPALNADNKEEHVAKAAEINLKLSPVKRDPGQQPSTATPVITSWTLTNHKLREPHLVNITKNHLPSNETAKPTHVTANIIQLKGPTNHNLPNNVGALRPIIGAPPRIGAPYQVINQMIRAQVPNMQPPTIKIPDQHILYQKPPGIVISPRMTNDPRLQSPKGSHSEGMTSPRLTNMAILSPSPQNLNVGLASPNNLQQRSPGHVTVVRMQQPPLSPIQALHVPGGARALVAPARPSRPNSVLVQAQGTPIHFNRLPVAPVLAPISKQFNPNNIVQQGKPISVVNSPTQQQKSIDGKKIEQRVGPETSSEPPKIFFTSSSLQHSTNPTVMAQNRLISMQNAIHVGNMNAPLQMTNKVLLNALNPADRRDYNIAYKEVKKSEHLNHIPYSNANIIHVAGVNHSTGHMMQTNTKTMSNPHDNIREGPNVIHTINSPRLLNTAPLQNMIQIDANKGSPSVLSMSTVRAPTVLTKISSPSAAAATTTSLTNVVMTPLLLKTGSPLSAIRMNKPDIAVPENHVPVMSNHIRETQELDLAHKQMVSHFDTVDRRKELLIMPAKPVLPVEQITKCETDFEELLKDNTNEIKVTNNPENKLEVNVGKTVTLVKTNSQVRETAIAPPQFQPTSSLAFETSENREVTSNSKVINIAQEKIQGLGSSEKEYSDVSEKPIQPTPINTSSPNVSSPSQVTVQGQLPSSEPNIGITKMKPIPSNLDNDMSKHNDEGDSWSAKDVNIESVIKKVDSLCNDSTDTDENSKDTYNMKDAPMNVTSDSTKSADSQNTSTDDNMDQAFLTFSEEFSEKGSNTSKRGGRGGMRGKKTGKNPDRVQTRQISKPARGSGPKRGRGRTNADKKAKGAMNAGPSNLPGDVYDFHEDSGDDDSATKSESRPRLILTIKSPLSGQTTAVSASSTTVPKEQVKPSEIKVPVTGVAAILSKDDKPEDFASPSTNTRKSRRLQEKDVQRNVDDDEPPTKSAAQTRGNKETNKRRATRQAGAKANNQDKAVGADARKSPRGVKRTRDRSISDASMDSSDEKNKKDEAPKEAKLPKTVEPPVAAALPMQKTAPAPASAAALPPTPLPALTPAPATVAAPAPALAPAPVVLPTAVVLPMPVSRPEPEVHPPVPFKPTPPVISAPPSIPTPITKPPKKMISEISAKLASAFEAAASSVPPLRTTSSPIVLEKIIENDASSRVGAEADEPMMGAKHGIEEELMPAATAEARPDAAYRNALPVGALEAADARVQSPALPHRPPSLPNAHRPADRATPVLIRAGEGASGYRAAYAGTASLPRGAHHPPPPPQHHPALAAGVAPLHHRPHPGSTARMSVTSVPNISPQGQIGLGDGIYPHFSHQQYQLYQQHFRATQHEARASPSPYTRSLEAEGSEAPAPPLELRRPPSARVPRPAHSPAPNDRLIMYGVVGGRSPPPAHATRPPSALPPPGPPGPPHASQVPREADSLQMLLRRYPVMWQGLLALKNDSAAVQMHFVGGNPGVAGGTLPRHTDGSTPPLRIAQRMRLEPAQLDQVHRKMKLENEHCMLLALPCGRDHMDVLQQSTNLSSGFITYLQRKQAAGIVNVAPPGHHQAMYTVHIFPSCDFANENLTRIAPDLMHRVADIAHLLIVIATV